MNEFHWTNNPKHWAPSPLSVKCPCCNQIEGENCRTYTGKYIRGRSHKVRTKLARKDWVRV